MGRWSARHRKIAIFGWLAFVVLAFAIGMSRVEAEAGDRRIRPGRVRPGGHDSRRRLRAAGRRDVLIQSEPLTADAPAFVAAIRAVVDALVAQTPS